MGNHMGWSRSIAGQVPYYRYLNWVKSVQRKLYCVKQSLESFENTSNYSVKHAMTQRSVVAKEQYSI